MTDGSRDYLVFTLAATIASYGEFGGHDRRGSLDRPGRSAILGLLGAALGIRRDEADRFAELDKAQLAIGVFDSGVSMRDYHTVQTVPSAVVRNPDSRGDALRRAAGRENTTLSQRDYRLGVLNAIALWGVPLAPLAQALQYPAFTLYLGRKSCPLSAPVAPRIVAAEGPVAALAQAQLPGYRWHRTWAVDGWSSQRPVLKFVASDCDLGGGHVERRNDKPLDRTAWHFGARDEHLLRLETSQ